MKHILKNTRLPFLGGGCAAVVLCLGFAFRNSAPKTQYAADTPLADVLQTLGMPKPVHLQGSYTPEEVLRGDELVHFCKTTHPPKGETSTYITKYYKCTSCHNTAREDADLVRPTPEARLQYAAAHDLPFLQGSTFWGIVNRGKLV